MNYSGMPFGMWFLFKKSFQKNLTNVLSFTETEAGEITKKAKVRYKEIINNLPDFEKGDRFKMNIVSCAMFSSFCLNLPKKQSKEKMTEYYEKSMMSKKMKWFCKKTGKKKFTHKTIEGLQKTAAFRAADRNIYSWNMDYLPYSDNSGYEARFYKCGICTLMNELGLNEYIPAMCKLDYTMSDAGETSVFVRKYTLASNGPYCDCGYKKKEV